MSMTYSDNQQGKQMTLIKNDNEQREKERGIFEGFAYESSDVVNQVANEGPDS